MEAIKSFEDYKKTYERSVKDPEGFWSEVADSFHWRKKWDKVLEWDFDKPEVKWFQGAKLNITENCLDRHLESRGDQPAIIWEPNDPAEPGVTLTYNELAEKVGNFANVLKKNGITKGDRVCIYMPMVPELAIALLACARIGAVHSVVFAGFSANSLADRINDSSCKLVLTTDGAYRGAKSISLKAIVDEALEQCNTVNNVIVLRRTNTEINFEAGRDLWWEDECRSVEDSCPAEEMDAEDLLFILYTSGSTGKPKGMVHSCGGYMVYTNYTFKTAFNYQPGDIYWCTADIGWITGHSYIVYGPLSAGATTLMFEGVPSYPDMGRFWQVVEKYKVNIFYTAPTAIRALQVADVSYVENCDLSSLKVLGTVGEPINEEAWHWYDKYVGKGNCPIIDTWWQTETGGFMISPIAHATPMKPSYASFPMPGVQVALVDAEGNEIEGNDVEGNLTIKYPWPSMARSI